MDKQQSWGWRPWLLIAGLLLSLTVVVFFAVHGLQRFPRRQVNEPIRAWMSVPYIARAYRVPAAVLYAALGLPAQPPDRRPIMFIARAQNKPVAAVIADLQSAVRSYRPPTTPTAPAPGGSTP